MVSDVFREGAGTFGSRRLEFESSMGLGDADVARIVEAIRRKTLRSPHAHARIKSMDVSKAERLPGVRAILTYKDPELSWLKPTSAGWTDGVDTVSYDRMMWRHFRDRRVLGDHACWVTDEVGAVVAAESERIAEEALRLIEVDWEVLPFVLDPLEAMKPGAPAVHPEIAPNNVLPKDAVGGADVFVNKGDMDRGFAEAENVGCNDSGPERRCPSCARH